MENGNSPVSVSGCPDSARSTVCPVEFTGNARDYMGIWLVNLVLSILTFGIWTPWAKVRRLRYFYGNTRIADGHFDYLAKPVRLLVGRVLVVVFLVAYSIADEISRILGLLVLLVLMVGLPWIINRSILFNARMTVWRNVRFDFRRSLRGAAWAYVIFPLFSMLSFGLLAPVGTRIAARFYVNRHALGKAGLHSDARLEAFYYPYVVAFALFWGVLFATLVVVGAGAGLAYYLDFLHWDPVVTLTEQLSALDDDPDDPVVFAMMLLLVYAFLFLFVPALVVAQTYYKTEVRRVILNNMVLEGGHRFRSTLSGMRYAGIVLTNTLAILLTLGLAAPWAAVRAWRYQCSCLSVVPAGPVDDFVSENALSGSAFGAEFTDIQALDIGI